MLKLVNQRCLVTNHLMISGFLLRPGFIAAQFAAHSTAARVKPNPPDKLRELEVEFGISWKSTCLPLSPDFTRKIDSNPDLSYKIRSLWEFTEPEYPDNLVSSSVSTQPRESLDVSLSTLFGTGGYLVRNNGDRVDLNADTFKGKHVLVCCFHVPPPLGSQRIINVCDEFCSTRDDVEVVMAAWMNTLVDADDHKQVFDHFFSAFPKSCLSVPFEDSKRRAHVCKLVADYTKWKLRHFPYLVLDTQGMALSPSERWALYSYGTSAFPYTEEILKDIKARELQLKKAASLEQLLLINSSSPDAVYRFNPEGGPREEVHISELNNKLVLLYMPGRSGYLFLTLVDIYEQCMKKQLEFEIVVAYSEQGNYSDPNDRKFYQEKIDRLLLQKRDICRQWWCLPLNSSVSARLDRLTQSYYIRSSDKLCVVGPAGGFIDLYAPGAVMIEYGVDGYPFTRDSIIQKEVSEIREITLESVFFSGDDLFRGTDRDDVTCAKKLTGKKISVYFGSLIYEEKVLITSYRELKAKDPEFEVVFVYTKTNEIDIAKLYEKTIRAMPWYVCSFESDRSESLMEKLKMNKVKPAIVGFGQDGRVCSVRRSYTPFIVLNGTLHKDVSKTTTFTLDDTLYEDVSKRRSDLPCES